MQIFFTEAGVKGSSKRQRKKYAVFMDLEKAFDKLIRNN